MRLFRQNRFDILCLRCKRLYLCLEEKAVPMLKLVIVLPTYNERENIQALIPALQDTLRAVPYQSHILVVDDNSPDGTADAVRSLMKEHGNLHLITGEKRGLGAA